MSRGFSILELMLSMTIISIVSIFGIQAFNKQKEEVQFVATQNKIKMIASALENFKSKYNYYPCPSSLISPSQNNNGLALSECILTCPTGLICTSKTVTGAIPVKSLELADMMGIDEWDQKISYTIDRRFTDKGPCEINGSITINDLSLGTMTVNTTQAHYALVSYGKNGKGAYKTDGTLQKSCGSSDESDYLNCSNSDTYINARYEPSNNSNYFDDIILWGNNPNVKYCPAGILGCSVWLDAADVCSISYSNVNSIINYDRNITKWYDKSVNSYIALPNNKTTTGGYFQAADQAYLRNNLRYIRVQDSGFYLPSVEPASTVVPLTDYTHIIVTKFISNYNGPTVVSAFSVNPDDDVPVYDRVIGMNSRIIDFSLPGNATIVGNSQCIASDYCNDDQPRIIAVTVDSTKGQSLFINGINVGTDSITNANPAVGTKFLQIGYLPDNPLVGDIYEVIIYNRVLSDIELKAVENYLANKWNISLTSP